MNRFFTDEQAMYFAQLYTGTDVPKLHHAPSAYVRKLELRCAGRGMTIQHLERLIREHKEQVEKLGRTIHRLERKLHKANRKYKALHRAMHEDSRNLRQSLIKAVERLAQSIAAPDPVVENAHGTIWPRFADGRPVEVGDAVKGVMCDVTVASIVFREDCVLLYDSQMFHYVKLDGGERAQRPDGTRLALD